MGKRNQLIHTQQTAPSTGARKKQANTINVDELQGSAQPQGNVQPQTATTVIGAQNKLNSSNVRSNSRQQQKAIGAPGGNTQLGNLGTANGSSLGTGPANNGFVAGTANIDQSSKNTINVY